MTEFSVPHLTDYPALLTRLRELIRASRVKAALAVNAELVLLYWRMGLDILEQESQQGWGAKVVEQLATDLRREFPEMTGISPRNLRYMKTFAAAWPDEAILQQAAAKIPWFHNCILLDKVKDPTERLWYVGQTIENGWSRNVLAAQVESGLYHRQGRAVTNFERTLPAAQSDLARQVLQGVIQNSHPVLAIFVFYFLCCLYHVDQDRISRPRQCTIRVDCRFGKRGKLL